MFLVLLSLFHHHWTTIIFDFQNVVTAFSSEFLFLNVFFNFQFFIDILFRILIACKYHTTFNVLFLIFNDQWICRFSLCRRVSVFFFFKNLAIFTLINQICRSCHQEVFPQMSVLQMFKKLLKKYIFEWTHFCELWIHSRKFMKVRILSWVVRKSSSPRIFTWSQKFSQWSQKVSNCEHTQSKGLIWLFAKVNSRDKSFLGLFAKVYVRKMQ